MAFNCHNLWLQTSTSWFGLARNQQACFHIRSCWSNTHTSTRTHRLNRSRNHHHHHHTAHVWHEAHSSEQHQTLRTTSGTIWALWGRPLWKLSFQPSTVALLAATFPLFFTGWMFFRCLCLQEPSISPQAKLHHFIGKLVQRCCCEITGFYLQPSDLHVWLLLFLLFTVYIKQAE